LDQDGQFKVEMLEALAGANPQFKGLARDRISIAVPEQPLLAASAAVRPQ
jgi:hypothetical protein